MPLGHVAKQTSLHIPASCQRSQSSWQRRRDLLRIDEYTCIQWTNITVQYVGCTRSNWKADALWTDFAARNVTILQVCICIVMYAAGPEVQLRLYLRAFNIRYSVFWNLHERQVKSETLAKDDCCVHFWCNRTYVVPQLRALLDQLLHVECVWQACTSDSSLFHPQVPLDTERTLHTIFLSSSTILFSPEYRSFFCHSSFKGRRNLDSVTHCLYRHNQIQWIWLSEVSTET